MIAGQNVLHASMLCILRVNQGDQISEMETSKISQFSGQKNNTEISDVIVYE